MNISETSTGHLEKDQAAAFSQLFVFKRHLNGARVIFMVPQSHYSRCLIVSLLLTLPLCGCGQSEKSGDPAAEEDAAFLDDLFNEVDLTDVPLPSESKEQHATANQQQPPTMTASLSSGSTVDRGAKTLRFPLVKTVEQTLVQKSELYPANAYTRLELHMDLEVLEVREKSILVDVRYGRVIYEQEINGERLTYDSNAAQEVIPQQVLPYAGMVQNGFAFRLGHDNEIQEAIGYGDFLRRCVQRLPEQDGRAFLASVSGTLNRESVDSFVDESIGLLPSQSAAEMAVGDVWVRERRLSNPVPLHISTTCRLLTLDEKTVTIDLNDRIQPETMSQTDAVRVTGGRSMGSCTVDRATGLPIEMNRSCYLNLIVMTAAGEAVEQEKRIETSIRSVSGGSGAVASRRVAPVRESLPSADSLQNGRTVIQQTAGFESLSPHAGAQSMPSPAGLSSTARAVYPD